MLGLIYAPIQKAKPPPAALVQSYASGVMIHALHQTTSLDTQAVEYSGNVVATYGPSTLTADRLTWHNDPTSPYAEASGNVKLVDPEGTITADHLKYNWGSQTGTGENITVRLSLLTFSAESIDMKPNLWTLTNVGGTGCRLRTPVYFIHTREVQVVPGVSMKAIHPQVSLLGLRLPNLPNQTLGFNEAGPSFDLPYPTYRNDHLGLNWTNELTVDPKTSLFTKYAIFKDTLPFYNATLMRSALANVDPAPIRSEIGDRFTFGYFDTIQVRDPASEHDFLRKHRVELGLSSTWGADAADVTTSKDKINKPIEALGEASGRAFGFGALGLFRAQEVKVGNGHTIDRMLFEGNVQSPDLPLLRNVFAFGRVDTANFVGGNSYGWLRGQAGIVFQPHPNIRLGASYTAAKEHGIPDFSYDQPLRFRELAMRADLDFDTTQIRVMLKYDPSQRAVFDRELYFSRVIGCLEPYVVYRERPHKFFLGIKLPITRAFTRLQNVAEQRAAAIRHTISGTP